MRKHFGIAIALCGLALPVAGQAADLRWLSYYSDKAKAEDLAGYDLLILDPDRHPPLNRLAERGKMLIGYLSLGEVERSRSYYAAVKTDGLLLDSNPRWPDSNFVDLRDDRWSRRVVEDIVPSILRKGFNGIFIDTLDDAAFLEAKSPRLYAGMRDAAAHLVNRLRLNYPQMTIIMNRGYDLLPQVEQDVDMVMAESLYSGWDFAKKVSYRIPDAEYNNELSILKSAIERQPKLKILTLDYGDPQDKAGLAKIYQAERANGFLPYVATIGLDQVVKEPRP